MRDQMLPQKALPHPELDEQKKAPLKNVIPGVHQKKSSQRKKRKNRGCAGDLDGSFGARPR